MAIAFLISSAAEVEPFTGVALDIAQRLDEPLAILCLAYGREPGGKKNEKKSSTKNGQSKDNVGDENDVLLTGFTNRTNYTEAVRAFLKDSQSLDQVQVF